MAFQPFTAIPQSQEPYSALINAAGQRRGFNPLFLSSVINAESGGNKHALGPQTKSGRAMGLMQFMPATFDEIAHRYSIKGDAYNPETNIEAGAAYLSELRDEFGNDRDTLMAYNWGPGNVRKWIAGGRNPRAVPEETKKYVEKILANAPSSLRAADDPGAAVAGMAGAAQPMVQTASAPGAEAMLPPIPQGPDILPHPASNPKALVDPMAAMQTAAGDPGTNLLSEAPPGDMLGGAPAEPSGLDAFMAKMEQPGTRQALLDAGAALLASSGWSARPITMGEALGKAAQAGSAAYTEGQTADLQKRTLEAKLAQMEAENASMAELRQKLGIGGTPASAPATGGDFQTAAGPAASAATPAAAATAAAAGGAPASFYDQSSESEKLLLSAATTPQELAKAQHDIVTARQEAAAAAQKLDYERSDKQFDKANTLRDDFRATTAFTSYNTVTPAYNQIQDIARKQNELGDKASGTNDLALIYAYAKILDPGSAVREGEVQFSQLAMPGAEKIINELKGLYEGKKMLSPEIRADIAANAATIFGDYKKTFDTTAQRFADTAKRYDIDKDEVVLPEVEAKEPFVWQRPGVGGNAGGFTPYQQTPADSGAPMLPEQGAQPQTAAPGDDAPVGTQWFFPGVGLMEMTADNGWQPVGGE